MRGIRFFGAALAATLNAVIGGYLLLSANGVFNALMERGTDWEGLTPLPSYPVVRLILYLAIAVILQFVSGWLLMPRGIHRHTAGFWGQYTLRVVLCMGACLVAAFVIIASVMSLLDAGVL